MLSDDSKKQMLDGERAENDLNDCESIERTVNRILFKILNEPKLSAGPHKNRLFVAIFLSLLMSLSDVIETGLLCDDENTCL